jgi:capsular exopolysaccharide synthesis family protein
MRKNVILGILLGLGFGAGLAFLREAMNTRLRRPEDVEKRGYPLLGVVPTMDAEISSVFDGRDFIEVGDREISSRLMPVLNPWSSVTENYRLIRTNLKHTDEESDTVLVTSSQQGEGKTTTAVNLALTAALGGQRVLLIDADMRRPTAHAALGTSLAPGLANLLASASKTNGHPKPSVPKDKPIDPSYIRRPLLDDLYFLPAGNADAAPAEILSSKTLRHLMDAVQQKFDLIVIDTPPTRAASDAIVIGSQTKARALIVSAEEADSRGLDAVVKSLRNVEVPIAGVIFNRFDERKTRDAGLYEYSYYGAEDYYQYNTLPESRTTGT